MERINHTTKRGMPLSNNTHPSRFKTHLFIFRLGGLPIMMKSTSTINTVYNVVLAVCFYVTAVCLFMDTFVHRRQLVYAMKKLRMGSGLIITAWMHISFRYAILGCTYIEDMLFMYNVMNIETSGDLCRLRRIYKETTLKLFHS
jgi:hypothetical protein